MSWQPYIRCARCGCLRPLDALLIDMLLGPRAGLTMKPMGGYHCADAALCGRLAGIGQGTLDADVGGPAPTKRTT